jgi:glycosyltransferase involved in cell wall biosynthesis
VSCPLRVAALTGGKNVASARFRVRQLIPVLSSLGVEVHEFVPPISKYPPRWKWLRPFWGIGALVVRLPAVCKSHFYDIVLFQRELISTFVTLEPLAGRPRVLDVDDAIFIYRSGKMAARLAGLSNLVICGNNFLAERFSNWNTHTIVIPTPVDIHRFKPLCRGTTKRTVIGWIGSSSNFKYLYHIEGVLEEIVVKFPNVYIRVIADRKPKFKGRLGDKLEWIPWSPETEVSALQDISVGIMPLQNGEWERGKCSYKMLQYMACGIPVVVSPVGMNKEVLSLGNFGLSATTQQEWKDALIKLLEMDPLEREKLGSTGRLIVEEHFSIEVIAPRFAEAFKSLVS